MKTGSEWADDAPGRRTNALKGIIEFDLFKDQMSKATSSGSVKMKPYCL